MGLEHKADKSHLKKTHSAFPSTTSRSGSLADWPFGRLHLGNRRWRAHKDGRQILCHAQRHGNPHQRI
jgi:hypothetical protein